MKPIAKYLVAGGCILCGLQSSCAVCGDLWYGYTVEGQFVDSAPELGEITGLQCSINREGESIDAGLFSFSQQADNGRFELHFVEYHCGTCKFLGLIGPPATGCDETLTVPDEIEIIVRRVQCQQRFLIELNQDTVVDSSYPDDIIALRDPIVTNACDE